MADGSIEFDTGIDTDGFKRDARTLKEAADACARSVENTGKRVYDAFNKSSKVTALESQISQTESKIQSLTAEMEQMGATKVPTEEYRMLSDLVDKTQIKLDGLLERQEKMEAMGTKKSSSSWKNLQYDIDATSRKLDVYQGELQETIDKERAFTSGMQTDAYQKKAARLAELNEKLYTQKQQLIEVIRKENEAAEASDKHTRALKKEGKEAQKTGKKMTMLGMIGRSILISFAMRAVSAIGTAIKEGYQNLAQYSDNVNISLSELQSSLLYLKNSFAAAFSPMLNYVVPALNVLIDTIANAVSWIGQLFAALTGKSTFVKAKKTQEDYAASLKKTGSVASKAGKEAERSTASFDKLNVISEQGTNGGGSGGASATDPSEMFETVAVSEMALAAMDKIKSEMNELKSFLQENKEEILAITGGLLAGIGAYFLASNWDTIAVGVISAFNGLKTGILAALSGISPAALGIAAIVGIVVAAIIDLWNTSEAFRATVTRAWELISGAAIEAWDTIWNLGLKPLGKALVELAKAIYDFYETSGLKKLFEVVISGIVSVAGYLLSVLISAIGATVAIITGAVAIIIRLIADVVNTVTWLLENWETVWNAIGSFLRTTAKSVIQASLNVIMISFEAFGVLISTIIGSALLVLDGFLKFLHIGFTQGWDKAWQNVGDIFRNVFNGIVQIAENAINYIVDSLNKMSFDVPEWVPVIGGEKFGFDLDRVRLPRLASGTVVPPRAGEFAAILGDNNREAEVVSPISAMKQAFKEAMNEMRGVDGDIYLTIELDGQKVHESVVRRNRMVKKQTGKNPLLV